MFGIRPEC